MLPDINGTATYIGYDAAVCIELFEPWVVEVYNSTVGNPTTLRIIENGNVVRDFNTGDVREKRMGKAVDDANVRRELTSRRIQAVYEAAHQNSVNQMIKDNGRDSWYVPSPIVCPTPLLVYISRQPTSLGIGYIVHNRRRRLRVHIPLLGALPKSQSTRRCE